MLSTVILKTVYFSKVTVKKYTSIQNEWIILKSSQSNKVWRVSVIAGMYSTNLFALCNSFIFELDVCVYCFRGIAFLFKIFYRICLKKCKYFWGTLKPVGVLFIASTYNFSLCQVIPYTRFYCCLPLFLFNHGGYKNAEYQS